LNAASLDIQRATGRRQVEAEVEGYAEAIRAAATAGRQR
jgi:hypothetical protein